MLAVGPVPVLCLFLAFLDHCVSGVSLSHTEELGLAFEPVHKWESVHTHLYGCLVSLCPSHPVAGTAGHVMLALSLRAVSLLLWSGTREGLFAP